MHMSLFKSASGTHSATFLTGGRSYCIILFALVLYCLPTPHIAGIFDNLTTGWCFIAPVETMLIVHNTLLL
jgi:hypothetical protein